MKILAIIMIAALAGGSTCAQSLDNITTITFTKQSRGLLDEVVITRDSVEGFVENHRAPEATQHYAAGMDADDWSRLILALKDVSLADIDGLQSPTMNRAHDGAIHSSLQITFRDGKTVTHSFDDENPHPDLKPLLDAVLQYRVPPSSK